MSSCDFKKAPAEGTPKYPVVEINSIPPEGHECSVGYDTELRINGEKFIARKVVVAAEAGSKPVEVTLTFPVGSFSFNGNVEAVFNFRDFDGELLSVNRDQYKAIIDYIKYLTGPQPPSLQEEV
jgi:hypothetical protein